MSSYRGSCHCGKVKYTVDLDLTKPATTCNCSICGRSGSMLHFVSADTFKLESGEEALTDYQFGKKNIHHLFCSTCGVKSFARGQRPDGTKIVAVNVRTLENLELDELPTRKFDGRAL